MPKLSNILMSYSARKSTFSTLLTAIRVSTSPPRTLTFFCSSMIIPRRHLTGPIINIWIERNLKFLKFSIIPGKYVHKNQNSFNAFHATNNMEQNHIYKCRDILTQGWILQCEMFSFHRQMNTKPNSGLIQLASALTSKWGSFSSPSSIWSHYGAPKKHS